MKLFNSKGFPYHRGRRLRSFNYLRDMVSENILTKHDLVMPYFVREDNDDSSIEGLKDLKRFSITELLTELDTISKNGLKAVALFPKVVKEKKSLKAEECYSNKNLICRTIKSISKRFPEMIIICDVALDAYTLSGHDGIIDSNGQIDNDFTIDLLSKMAVNFAESGCRVIAPSDMMDGRVKIIRENLEKNGFFDTNILSYSAKFCSNFYTPFRDALGSKENLGNSKKNSYQLNYNNSREALKESIEDIYEGADIVMVKPAGYYLDIIKEIRDNCLVPIAAYQVSGEYCLIKSASEQNLISFKDCVLESLSCIKRSGADIIFSYFAKDVAEWLK